MKASKFRCLRLHSRRGCVPATALLLLLSKNCRLRANFSNATCGVTEPKEAPFAGTGENAKTSLYKNVCSIFIRSFILQHGQPAHSGHSIFLQMSRAYRVPSRNHRQWVALMVRIPGNTNIRFRC